MALNFGSGPTEPIPHAILADIDTEFFYVCFEPDVAGIICEDPRLFSKSALSTRYPHVVKAWEIKQRNEKEEAQRTEKHLLAMAGHLQSPNPNILEQSQMEKEVACSQNLLPGMSEHWGELRKCETHHSFQCNRLVCKGCRVSHCMQQDGGFDSWLIMSQGARVPVCESCAAVATEVPGVERDECVCDTKASCYRCRESLLEKLARARKNRHCEGLCGRCGGEGLVQLVDFCLYCRKMRVYVICYEET